MKKYKIAGAVGIIILVAMIGVILCKNITFLSYKLSNKSYKVIPAVVENIQPAYNRVENMELQVTYLLDNSQYRDTVYYSIGDRVGDEIELLVRPGKQHAGRNKFVLSWTDLLFFIYYAVIAMMFRKQYEKRRQQGAIRYAKALYYQQIQAEQENIVGREKDNE